ncbi:MAG TPA: nitrous oxide reductase accessory protein NosL [Gemmatimonadaceae bacterium]|nr:nitrous oxide reductase accessory protein NosL [Gemmatimonadaceae bacterium]
MTRLSRFLTATAAILLIGLYFLPIWKVELVAPQYPEGLGMYIEVSDIRGFGEFDLQKINNLNHYIGMQEIDPASIPELRYLPWVLGALIAFGLVAAALGRRRLLHAWMVVLVVAAVAGLADFYRWGYDYGHNLDDTAIIKVPGMAYQPPLIGTKQLLNFRAASWPASGGLLAGVAFLMAAGAAFVTRGGHGRAGRGAIAAAALAVSACATGEVHPIAYDGSESCEYCRMVITDRRFGAEIVTRSGRALKFDSIECLASFVNQGDSGTRPRSIWVTDYSQPGTLIPVETARFVQMSDGPSSPMGMGLRAHAAASTAADEDAMDWVAVLELVAGGRTTGPADYPEFAHAAQGERP